MSEDANISDNNPSPEVLGAVARRRPGRPRGLPKPEGSGRKPGTPNRVGKEARELAGRYTTKAFKRLAEMLDSKDDKAAAIACREILDRAFGKPISPTELTGKDGAPLVPAPEMSDHDLAMMTMHLLIRGGLVENEPLIQARKPTVIEQKPVDPFAAQRAEQSAEIAAAEEPATGPDDTATRWSEMKAAEEERHAAPWRCEDHTPGFTKVVPNRNPSHARPRRRY